MGLVMQATKVSTSARMPGRRHLAHRDAPRQAQALDKENNPVDALIDQWKIKASIRAKVEHPF